jgi:hypothetical protein
MHKSHLFFEHFSSLMIDKESLLNIMFNGLQAKLYGSVNEMFVHDSVLRRL